MARVAGVVSLKPTWAWASIFLLRSTSSIKSTFFPGARMGFFPKSRLAKCVLLMIPAEQVMNFPRLIDGVLFIQFF